MQSFFLLLLATLKLLRFAKHLTQITKQVLLWVPKTEWVRREIARDYGCTQKQRGPREQDCLSHVLLIDNPNLGGVRFRRAECGQQRNRLRDAPLPFTQSCDPRL